MKIGLTVLALGLAFALSFDVTHNMSAKSEGDSSQTTTAFLQIAEDYKQAKAQNAELAAWIDIPHICYEPVMFRDSADGNEYYLNHDYQNGKSKFGAVFINRYNPKTLFEGDAVLLHGHNYNGQSQKQDPFLMFGDLPFYKLESFFAQSENEPIRVYDGQYLRSYRVFTVFMLEDGKADEAVQTQWASSQEKNAYMRACYEKSIIKLWEPDYQKRVIFLSTCDYSREYPNPYAYKEPRLVVGAYETQTEAYR